ncbi:acyl carrier protein [Plantactinospora sonchi]|uniref:Acyl carrier protein n=1 Tax=Plantactinospora sonchi TaxID=1544735 RepID=A0ABU7RWQ2_9ACTN
MTDGETENGVLEIVREVLDADPVRLEDDLFDLGFSSLAIVRTAARVRDRFGAEPALSEYFEAVTVADLVAVVAAARPR